MDVKTENSPCDESAVCNTSLVGNVGSSEIHNPYHARSYCR